MANENNSSVKISGVERFFDDDEIIVSKTDEKGRLTYVNNVFLRLASYTEKEVLGQPHSLVRHPEMPRCVFKLLWDTISTGKELFAYVVNRAKNGDHYWVLAHVTPSFDDNGKVIGYHSNRRTPDRKALESTIIPLYQSLLAEEAKHANRKDGMMASYAMLEKILEEKGVTYEQFIFSL